ncbi:MAG: carboxy terminal-processing peptidase [Alphaproteobacteria bacterium]|nr:carboxy terminal-processing peptidase [Alphaproteobacteria bacterium]
MKNKGKLVLLSIFLIGFVSIFFNSKAFKPDPDKERRILSRVIEIIKQEHYSPKPIDDSFSKIIFYRLIESMDESKTLFSQQDINGLSSFLFSVDDEINGTKPIQFVNEVSKIFNDKANTNNMFNIKLLSEPIDFTVDEFFETQEDKIPYSVDENQRLDRLRKNIKYQVLVKYQQELEDREKNKNTKDYVAKTDAELEQKARESVLKNMNRNYNRIKNQFNDDKKFDLFVNLICETMDPHSSYLPPQEKRALQESLSGKFYGIGALLGYSEEGMKISSVQPGGPAWKSGQLLANDIIMKVAQGDGDFVDITGFEVTDAVKLIRGEKGSIVRLYIKKQNGTFVTLSLIREEIVQDEVYARSVIVEKNNQKVGYIRLQEFYFNYDNPNGDHNCAADVATEITKLKSEKVDKIIIDLRYNGGGSLNEVKKMIGLFIDQGPVVQVRDRNGKIYNLDDTENGTLFNGDLAVMVNEYSASASEIFAAAIQDYKRGLIIGSSSTFGKGTVQRPYPVGRIDYSTGETDLGIVKLTFQKYYRINGASVQKKGVISDIVIPDEAEIYKNKESDDKYALAWDEIRSLNYQMYSNNSQVQTDITKGLNFVKKDTTFSLIDHNLKFLENQAEKVIPLNLNQYKIFVKETNSTISQNNALLKLKQAMKITVLKEDNDKFYNNPDKPKQERYQAWLKALENDKYIDVVCEILAKNK